MEEIHVFFKGRVQGVGFRSLATKYAQKLGLTGIVRNMPDGRVELIAQGDRASLETLIYKIEHHGFPGHIEETLREFRSPEKSYAFFEIT